jgi:hypothetical protein
MTLCCRATGDVMRELGPAGRPFDGSMATALISIWLEQVLSRSR